MIEDLRSLAVASPLTFKAKLGSFEQSTAFIPDAWITKSTSQHIFSNSIFELHNVLTTSTWIVGSETSLRLISLGSWAIVAQLATIDVSLPIPFQPFQINGGTVTKQ